MKMLTVLVLIAQSECLCFCLQLEACFTSLNGLCLGVRPALQVQEALVWNGFMMATVIVYFNSCWAFALESPAGYDRCSMSQLIQTDAAVAKSFWTRCEAKAWTTRQFAIEHEVVGGIAKLSAIRPLFNKTPTMFYFCFSRNPGIFDENHRTVFFLLRFVLDHMPHTCHTLIDLLILSHSTRHACLTFTLLQNHVPESWVAQQLQAEHRCMNWHLVPCLGYTRS